VRWDFNFSFFSRLSFGGGAKSGENLTLSTQSSPHGVISHQGGNSYGADSLRLDLLRSQDDGLRCPPSIHPAEGHNSRGLVLTTYGSNVTLTPCIAVRAFHFSDFILYEQVSPYPGEDSIIIHTDTSSLLFHAADSASSQLNNDTTHVSLSPRLLCPALLLRLHLHRITALSNNLVPQAPTCPQTPKNMGVNAVSSGPSRETWGMFCVIRPPPKINLCCYHPTTTHVPRFEACISKTSQ
jgi:hypothetical protein